MTEDIAWAAGFIEGEGTVRINLKRNKYKYFIISVSQTSTKPLDKLKSIFGGKVYGPYQPRGIGKKLHYLYQIHGKSAEIAANLVLPYLFDKGIQCRAALKEIEEYHHQNSIPRY